MKINNSSTNSYPADLQRYLAKIASVQIPLKNDVFRERVSSLRRKWKIPTEGFKSEKYCKKWLEDPPWKILKRQKTVEQIEKEIIHLGKNEKIVKEWIPAVSWGLSLGRKICKFPIGSFLTDIDQFMIENNIDDALKEPFLHYLYYGSLSNAPFRKKIVECSERITITKSGSKVCHLVNLIFGPNTRQKDILAVWDTLVSPLQRSLPGYLTVKKRNRSTS